MNRDANYLFLGFMVIQWWPKLEQQPDNIK
jgi:hypothetical protein